MTDYRDMIFLVGARASGKSTVGRRLSRELGREYVDTDARLAESRGTSIAALVAAEGWDAFRILESETLEQLIQGKSGAVVATGGGIILAERNRRLMRQSGLVFYLSAPAEVLVGRMAVDPQSGRRPSLTGQPVLEEMAQVLADREGLYRDSAHQIIDAAAELDQIIQDIIGHVSILRPSA